MTPDISEATVERVADYCEVHGVDHDAAGGEANRVAFAEAAALLRALRARLTEVERVLYE